MLLKRREHTEKSSRLRDVFFEKWPFKHSQRSSSIHTTPIASTQHTFTHELPDTSLPEHYELRRPTPYSSTIAESHNELEESLYTSGDHRHAAIISPISIEIPATIDDQDEFQTSHSGTGSNRASDQFSWASGHTSIVARCPCSTSRCDCVGSSSSLIQDSNAVVPPPDEPCNPKKPSQQASSPTRLQADPDKPVIGLTFCHCSRHKIPYAHRLPHYPPELDLAISSLNSESYQYKLCPELGNCNDGYPSLDIFETMLSSALVFSSEVHSEAKRILYFLRDKSPDHKAADELYRATGYRFSPSLLDFVREAAEYVTRFESFYLWPLRRMIRAQQEINAGKAKVDEVCQRAAEETGLDLDDDIMPTPATTYTNSVQSHRSSLSVSRSFISTESQSSLDTVEKYRLRRHEEHKERVHNKYSSLLELAHREALSQAYYDPVFARLLAQDHQISIARSDLRRLQAKTTLSLRLLRLSAQHAALRLADRARMYEVRLPYEDRGTVKMPKAWRITRAFIMWRNDPHSDHWTFDSNARCGEDAGRTEID